MRARERMEKKVCFWNSNCVLCLRTTRQEFTAFKYKQKKQTEVRSHGPKKRTCARRNRTAIETKPHDGKPTHSDRDLTADVWFSIQFLTCARAFASAFACRHISYCVRFYDDCALSAKASPFSELKSVSFFFSLVVSLVAVVSFGLSFSSYHKQSKFNATLLFRVWLIFLSLCSRSFRLFARM